MTELTCKIIIAGHDRQHPEMDLIANIHVIKLEAFLANFVPNDTMASNSRERISYVRDDPLQIDVHQNCSR